MRAIILLMFAALTLAPIQAGAESWRDHIVWQGGPARPGVCSFRHDLPGGAIYVGATEGSVRIAIAHKGMPKDVRWLEVGGLRTPLTPEPGQPQPAASTGRLDAPLLKALRDARHIAVVDATNHVLRVGVGAGDMAFVLDAAVPCSKGEGPGHAPLTLAQAASRPAPASVKEIFWRLEPASVPTTCSASRTLEGVFFSARQEGDRLQVQVLFSYPPRGKTGLIEAGGFRAGFEPDFDGGGLIADAWADGPEQAALVEAPTLSVQIDGRPIGVFRLRDAGFAEVVESLRRCARGEFGWWGPGAPQEEPDRAS